MAQIIGQGLRDTFGLALLVSTIGGILFYLISALRPYSRIDYLLTGFAFSGIAMPGFFLGLLLNNVVAFKLRLLPTGGISSPGVTTWIDYLEHLILAAPSWSMLGAVCAPTWNIGSKR